MEIRILGPLEVATVGRLLPLGGPRQQVVLSVLALEPDRVVSVDRLVDAVWGDAPPPTARRQIRICVSALRRCFAVADGPTIRTQSPGYRLPLPEGTLDSQRFEQLVAKAQQATWIDSFAEAAANLRTALRLWRGPALAGVPSRIVQASTVRLEEARLSAIEERIRLDLALGRHQEVTSEIIALATAEPFREKVQAYLMLALHRSGRPAEALEVYRRTRIAFIEELGIEPSLDLQRMHNDILTHDPHLGLPAVGEVVQLRPPAQAEETSAPQQLSSGTVDIVGREKEIAEIGSVLAEEPHHGHPLAPNIVAPTGRGGAGKFAHPSLAANKLLDSFPDDGQLFGNPATGQDPPAAPQRVTTRLPHALGMATHALVDEDAFALDGELKIFMSLNDKASCGLVVRLLCEVNRAKGETASANENCAAEERAGRSRTAELTQQLAQARTTASTEHALRQAAQACSDAALARSAELGEQLAQAQQASGIDRALRDRAFAQQQTAEAGAAVALQTATCEHDQLLRAEAELTVAADRLTEQEGRTAEARADLEQHQTAERADRRLLKQARTDALVAV